MLLEKYAAKTGVLIALFAVIALLIARPLIVMHGLPAFNHDWSWPPDAIAARALFLNSVGLFSDNNFGSLNYYAGSAAGNAVIAACVLVFGSLLGLKILVLVLVGCAGVSTYALARAIGAARLAAVACGIVYCASPVVGNELAAGHVAYLFGYSLLPLIALCALDIARGGRALPVLALLAAVPLSIAQPQFGPFDAIVVLAFIVFATSRRSAALVVLVALFALLASPLQVSLALFGHALSGLSFDKTTLHWEAANSTSFWPTFLGAGYPSGYDRAAGSVLLTLGSAGGAALWAAALWALRETRAAIAFVGLSILAALVCAGINGPLAGAIAYAFVHVPQSALFRELYHFSVLVVLGLVIALACTRSRFLAVPLAIAAVLYAAPQLSGAFWHDVSGYDASEIRQIDEVVASDTAQGSVLYWPLLQPLGPPSMRGGADPDAFAIGPHASIAEFLPMQPVSQLGFLICDRHRAVRPLLEQFGIRYVVVRPHWGSLYFQKIEPMLRMFAVSAPAPGCGTKRLIAALPAIWRGTTHVLLKVPEPKPFVSSRFSDPVYRLPVAQAFAASSESVNPHRTFVDGVRWQWRLPDFMGPVNPGIFAVRGVTYRLGTRTAPVAIWYSAPAGLLIDGSDFSQRLAGSKGYRRAIIAPEATSITALGPTMLAGIDDEKADDSFACAGCESLEVLEVPGTGWTLRSRDGKVVPALNRSWDMKWRFDPRLRPVRLVREVPTAIVVGLIAQDVVWCVAMVAFFAAIAMLFHRFLAQREDEYACV